MSTSSSSSASTTAHPALATQTADTTGADAGQLGLFNQSIRSAAALGAVCLVIHIGTFIATLAVARKAAHVRGRGVLLLLAVALWVLAFVNEAATLGFYQTAATHGDQTTEAAYRYLADNQAGPWNVAVLVSGFLATVLADGYLLVRCYQWWTHVNLRLLVPLAVFSLLSFGWNLAEVAYTAGHPEGNKSEWVMPAFGGWPAAVALSGSLHVIFSALLGYRVVSVARTARGRRPAVGSVVVEAAVPYSVVSIIFMSVYCAGIAAANVFGSMVVQFQGITVDLIIIRAMKAGPDELTPSLLSPRRDLRSTPARQVTVGQSVDLEYAATLSKEEDKEKKWSMASKPSSLDEPLPVYTP